MNPQDVKPLDIKEAPRKLIIELANRIPKAFYKHFLSTYEHDLKAAIVLAFANTNGECFIKLTKIQTKTGSTVGLAVSEVPFESTARTNDERNPEND